MCQADDHHLGSAGRRTALVPYAACVMAAGAGVLAWGGVRLSTDAADGLPRLVQLPGLWILAVLIVFGELRPITSPGRRDGEGITTSTTFTFAVLLYLGLPIAAVLHALASLLYGVARRHATWRNVFNMAQYALSLAAAYGVLAVFGVAATPAQPKVPDAADLPAVGLAALAYLTVNNLLVWRGLAWWQGGRFVETVRAELAYQAAVGGVLLGLSPLVVVVLAHRPWFIPLFGVALVAVYRSASISRAREQESLHDSLTGLPNRKMLIRSSEQALAAARRRGGRMGLFLLDLDRFKEINDTLGHLTGDRLLALVAERLKRALRPGDVVGRLGGDEFAILLPTVPDAATARAIAARVVDVFAQPFNLDGLVLDLEASVGIALYPDHAADFEGLLQRADVAMYLAKGASGGIEMYAVERDRNTPDRLALLGDLRRALDAGDLDLYYQPKVSFADGAVVGLEALVRWTHPIRGPMSPELFVQLAEQTGLMPRLTEYVLQTALAQAAVWWRTGITVPIAVNVSLRDIHAPGFVHTISEGLRRYGVPASALQLEITERVLLEDPNRVSDTISGLEELGVRLSLDDFGTGYSSLVHLRRMPVSEIKIDRSFVARLTDVKEDAAIVRSTVDLAHSLGIRVVAEGVEDDATWEQLRRLGCDVAQGWLVARAMPGEQATAWLAERMGCSVAGDAYRA
ncbi:bifunctional diguanylate cyclase/phosphodiesterase [Carbonactinospora thermoautotrophica]|uniref:Diguanylate cyclase/phosphodiesterase n=1 Tax=Carbonactinospora thermoautotrophica TaxID=1469144 RepID=A0A132MP19_9ACTN|nr:EAL domain-containing protein [Carbonactinospora thermoautotrophica]KWW99598.1 Diguanylate cyclase/phosphodiesterase [Carbonactinospora thermoautotrophica]MCX9191830.1 bifunctional diguanylate cyclase/phosphodiesterase [Carbonactinospora thermoautotrophica]